MANYGLNKEKLEAQIASVDYLRFGATGTFCYLTLVNGYTVTGESGCIDPAIFNEEIGKQIAYDNAFDKLWGVLGYSEKQRWYEETQLTYKDRLANELAQLDEKRSKLMAFIDKGKPDIIALEEWERLHKQLKAMDDYSEILADRLAFANRA